MNKKVIGLIVGLGLIGSVAEDRYEQYKYEQDRLERATIQETISDYEIEESRKQLLEEHRSYSDSACRGRRKSHKAHGYDCECITCIG